MTDLTQFINEADRLKRLESIIEKYEEKQRQYMKEFGHVSPNSYTSHVLRIAYKKWERLYFLWGL